MPWTANGPRSDTDAGDNTRIDPQRSVDRAMEKCTHHPDRETRFQCLKHNVWLCEECLKCRDPELYCKNRSACPIWFIEKRRRRQHSTEQPAVSVP
jgi:hypothetical protein